MSKPSFKIGLSKYEFKEISLATYYKLQDLLMNPEKDTEYLIVECLTDCPIATLRKLKYGDWVLVWDEAQLQITRLKGNADSINPIIEFKGVKYGLPAIEDITVGEFVDLDLILADKNADRKLEDIAAILYRPVIEHKGNILKIEDYDTDGFKYRKELFLDLPVSAVKSANSFFLQCANSSLRSTLNSLLQMEETKMMDPKDLEKLQKAAQLEIGGDLSTLFLEETFLNLRKLRSSRSEPLSTGLRGKKDNWIKRLWPTKNKTTKA